VTDLNGRDITRSASPFVRHIVLATNSYNPVLLPNFSKPLHLSTCKTCSFSELYLILDPHLSSDTLARPPSHFS